MLDTPPPTSRRLNILFSSTVQWNVGDEFIYHGIKRLFGRLGIRYNSILFNRNPEIATPRPKAHWWKRLPPAPPAENSFKPALTTSDDWIDHVVFAGTPEWIGGERVEPLLKFVCRSGVRCSFIGVGLSEFHDLSADPIAPILKNQTDLFISRDTHAQQAASPFVSAQRASCCKAPWGLGTCDRGLGLWSGREGVQAGSRWAP